jgi:ketosteroid isomerase-like protein
MPEENVEIVRKAYDAFNRRDWDGVFRDADPDFALTTQVGPDAGTHRGREEVTGLAQGFIDVFDKLLWEPEEFFEGNDQVVVYISVRSRPPGGGVDLVVRNGHLWTIRDGALISMESFPKPGSALEAAGLSE